MKRAPVAKASLALVLLIVGGHSVHAAHQGVVTLLCTWNKQCTSAGACSSYTGSAHY